MSEVTISKKEYSKLKEHSRAYKKVATKLFAAVVRSPIEDLVRDFKSTGIYSNSFLNHLERGLRRSSYSK